MSRSPGTRSFVARRSSPRISVRPQVHRAISVPSTVADIFAASCASPSGVERWRMPPTPPTPRTALATGIYVVALTDQLDSRADALAEPPISETAIDELLTARPELTLDRTRPTREHLIERLAAEGSMHFTSGPGAVVRRRCPAGGGGGVVVSSTGSHSGLADTNVNPAGSGSETTTFAAVFGPWLVTFSVNVSSVPGVAGEGAAVFSICRSAFSPNCTVAGPGGLIPTSSEMSAGPLVYVPAVAEVTLTLTVQ